MIKTVIFDIGNVLMKFAWWPYVTSIFDAETAKIVSEAMWREGYWNEFDRGVMTEEAIREKMIACAPEYEKQIYTALEQVAQCMHKFDYAIPWIKDLKEKGYQVLYLSNYSKYLMRMKPEVLDFLPYMDGGVFSCDAKVIKPDKAIYATICEKYHLNPEECIFIDDNQANIDAANAFGIHGIWFEGYEKSYQEIMKYLEEEGQ